MKKFTLFAGVIVVVGLSLFCLVQHESVAELRAQNQAQQQRLAELSAKNERLSNDLAQTSVTQSSQPDQLTELLRLRNEVYLLRKLTNTANLVRCTDSEIGVGPNLNVSYDPAVWQPLSSVKNSEVESTTWEIQCDGWVQITVSNHSTQKSESDYSRERLERQTLRGQPADLIGERHESIGGRDWLVLDFNNSHFRPPRREISYFLPTDSGHITLFVVAEEPNLLAHKEAIDAFLTQIRIQ
jgi:hypothetical protein